MLRTRALLLAGRRGGGHRAGLQGHEELVVAVLAEILLALLRLVLEVGAASATAAVQTRVKRLLLLLLGTAVRLRVFARIAATRVVRKEPATGVAARCLWHSTGLSLVAVCTIM